MKRWRQRLRSRFVAAGVALLLTGCIRTAPPSPLPTNTEGLVPTPTDLLAPTLSGTALPYDITDANALVSGICFESANDAAGRVFVLRSAEELTTLFDLSDNSQFCRHPVRRAAFDFGGGNVAPRAIAGLWSRGRGCVARHEVTAVERDDVARTFILRLRFIPEGECNYELVRPFWVSISGFNDYDIRLVVE